jgi:hypothetical protein
MSKTTSSFTVGLLIGGILCSLFYGYLSRQELTKGDADAPRAKTLKMAHALPTNHPVHIGIEHMGKHFV